MYYYDPESRDMEWTDDARLADMGRAAVTAASFRYGLRPDLAARLYELLGPADPEMDRREAIERLTRALRALGLEAMRLDVVYELLDDSWKAVIDVRL